MDDPVRLGRGLVARAANRRPDEAIKLIRYMVHRYEHYQPSNHDARLLIEHLHRTEVERNHALAVIAEILPAEMAVGG